MCLDGERMNWGGDYAEYRTREYGEGRGNVGREEGVCGGKSEYGGDGYQMLGGGRNEYPHMLSSLLPQRDDRIWEEGIRMLRGGACKYGEDAKIGRKYSLICGGGRSKVRRKD